MKFNETLKEAALRLSHDDSNLISQMQMDFLFKHKNHYFLSTTL